MLRNLRSIAILTIITLTMSVSVAADILLPAGTELKIRIPNEVSSGNVRSGELIDVELAEAINFGGLLAIEKGARGRAHVTELQPAGRPGKPGRVAIELLVLKANQGFQSEGDTDIKIKAVESPVVAEGKGKKLLSWILGFGLIIKGSQGVIPADTIIPATIQEDIIIVFPED